MQSQFGISYFVMLTLSTKYYNKSKHENGYLQKYDKLFLKIIIALTKNDWVKFLLNNDVVGVNTKCVRIIVYSVQMFITQV